MRTMICRGLGTLVAFCVAFCVVFVSNVLVWADEAPAGDPPAGVPPLAPSWTDAAPAKDAPAEGTASPSVDADGADADQAAADEDGDADAGEDDAGEDDAGEGTSGEPTPARADTPGVVLEDGVLEDGVLEDGDAPVVVEPAPGTRRLVRRPVHGSFRLNYRLRHDGDESDNDLDQRLSIDIGDEHAAGLSFSFNGRLREDLDGRSDKGHFFVFDSITDTYRSRVNGRLYHAYATYRPGRGAVEFVRVGRQWIEAGELIHVDGARIDFAKDGAPSAVAVSVFGGIPAHLFEGSLEGDATFGVSVHGTPWLGGDLRFDYAYIDDRTNFYGNTTNNLFTLTLRQQVTRNISWWGAYQQIDRDPRTLRFAFTGSVPQQDFLFHGSFYSILDQQNTRVTELDPFFSVVQGLEAYWMGDVSLSKGLADRLFAEVGVAVRRLFDGKDESTFNREFTRYWFSVSLDDWPAKSVFLTATGERWESADDAYTVGFEIEHRPNKRVKLQLGTDYTAYRFDLYTAGERQSVRSYYARLVVRTAEHWRLHARLRVEDDKFDTYAILDTGFQVDF